MSGINVKYKDTAIASLSDTGKKTLKTGGKYCEGDIAVEYTKPTASELASGTKSITTNGSHDVVGYKSAEVNVPIPSGYIKPSGTKEITENGTFDVTSFTSAVVNVQTQVAEIECKKWEFTLNSDVTNGGIDSGTMLFNDPWIGEHFNDERLVMAWYPKETRKTKGVASALFGFGANRALFGVEGGTAIRTGCGMRVNASDSMTNVAFVAPIKAYGETGISSIRIYANGNFTIYCSSSYPLRAGTYEVVAWLL